MRQFLVASVCVCLLAALAARADGPSPCNDHLVKTDAHVLTRPAADRQGGETVLDATVIPSLPYADTGATCDNLDDYDEAWIWVGPTRFEGPGGMQGSYHYVLRIDGIAPTTPTGVPGDWPETRFSLTTIKDLFD
jgi:hypothetical protein